MAIKPDIISRFDLEPNEIVSIAKTNDESYIVSVTVDGQTESKEIYLGAWMAHGIDSCAVDAVMNLRAKLYRVANATP